MNEKYKVTNLNVVACYAIIGQKINAKSSKDLFLAPWQVRRLKNLPKLSVELLGKEPDKVECPFCGKLYTEKGLTRHVNGCKLNPDNIVDDNESNKDNEESDKTDNKSDKTDNKSDKE